MDELRNEVTRQLQQLQTLMHRMAFHGFSVEGKPVHNPYRGQGRVLAILKERPEISQKELTDLLEMSRQGAAELLSKLEKNGLIQRYPSAEDRRGSMVRLLPAGEEAAGAAEGSGTEIREIFDCLDGEELAMFSDCLGRVIHRCARYFPGEDEGQQDKHMELFLNKYDHSFTSFHAGGHKPREER